MPSRIVKDEDDVRWSKPCLHPEHRPPTMIVIPPGHRLEHECPECGAKAVIRGRELFL